MGPDHSDEWTPTGRTRLRGLWFGLLAYEVEETRIVNTWMPGAPYSPMNWCPVYRWRRVSFGGVIDLQGTVPGKRIAAHLAVQTEAKG
ncbi:hypothetical protein [Methylorubrum populi]|nr:hypothetical protein [Methylorubrum populi]